MEKQLKVDAEILKFLIGTYFGKYNDKYKMVADKAYLDMNRTLRFDLDRAKLRNHISFEAPLRWEIKQWNKEVFPTLK